MYRDTRASYSVVVDQSGRETTWDAPSARLIEVALTGDGWLRISNAGNEMFFSPGVVPWLADAVNAAAAHADHVVTGAGR